MTSNRKYEMSRTKASFGIVTFKVSWKVVKYVMAALKITLSIQFLGIFCFYFSFFSSKVSMKSEEGENWKKGKSSRKRNKTLDSRGRIWLRGISMISVWDKKNIWCVEDGSHSLVISEFFSNFVKLHFPAEIRRINFLGKKFRLLQKSPFLVSNPRSQTCWILNGFFIFLQYVNFYLIQISKHNIILMEKWFFIKERKYSRVCRFILFHREKHKMWEVLATHTKCEINVIFVLQKHFRPVVLAYSCY